MRFLSFLFILFLFSAQNNLVCGQKVITGRVLSEDLEPLLGAFIFNQDTIKLVETNEDGFFELIILPESVKKLIFGYVGFEWTTINLSDDCNYLEVILLYAGTYDFMSSRKIDRLRKKAFERLTELHHIAVTRGLFEKDSICYTREFIPDKPNLDRISEWMSQQVKQNKKRFSDFKIGDTIKIPFSSSFNCDGTKRTCLIPYSYVANMEKYDCIINGQILSKNRHKGAHNIVFKVIDCNSCIKPSPIFQEKEMVPGAIFEYDIVFFKVLN
jgi:hypothetical protein